MTQETVGDGIPPTARGAHASDKLSVDDCSERARGLPLVPDEKLGKATEQVKAQRHSIFI